MATFRTYAEVLRPDHPLMKNYKASLTWRPSRYRPVGLDRDMRAEPGVVLGDVLRRTGGVYETTTRLTPKFREHIREIAELTSDNELIRVSELPEVPVSLEHLRHVEGPHSLSGGLRIHADWSADNQNRLRRDTANLARDTFYHAGDTHPLVSPGTLGTTPSCLSS